MAVNKVVFGGKTVIDLMDDSVTPDALTVGETAHGANGEKITGTNPYVKAETDTTVDAQSNLITQIGTLLSSKVTDQSEVNLQAEIISQIASALNGKAINN